MKRTICLITALCLVLGSFSFTFAQDWSATDSNNLANIRASVMSGGQLYNVVNACNTALNNINYNLVTLMGWLDPSTGGSTSALLNQILSMLSYTDVGGALKSWLSDIWFVNSGELPNLTKLAKALTNEYQTFGVFDRALNAHNTLTDGGSNYYYNLPTANGGSSAVYTKWNDGSPLGNIALICTRIVAATTLAYTNTYSFGYSGYNSSQTFTKWDDLTSSSFTPTSATNGLYTWLSKIQTPVARLSYVLASDQRIEAQELAAENEQAVVDNFIDSDGAGSASASDIGSVSDLSSGFSSNISTDADPGDIFDIFDSNNFSWFSQEVADSLDTTNSNNRSKSGSEFDTPLLDQRIDNIYNALGVKHD